MISRLAGSADCLAIAEIYNLGIREGRATFEVRDRTEEDVRHWLTEAFPLVVVESEGEVIAFARASVYRSRECYRGIAEFGVYVHPAFRGVGAGKLAMTALEGELAKLGFWKLVSRIFVDNAASRGLMASLGFREVGIYEKHAQLDRVWRDVVIVEKWFGAGQEFRVGSSSGHVYAEDYKKFPNLKDLKGKRVVISGTFSAYQETHPEVKLKDLSQLQIAESTKEYQLQLDIRR